MEDSGFDSDSKSNGERRCHADPPEYHLIQNFELSPLRQPKKTKEDYSDEINEKNILAKDPLIESPISSGGSESPEVVLLKTDNSTAQLQKRLEKHIQQGKKIKQQISKGSIDTQPRKFLIPRNRLPVPSKPTSAHVTNADEQPLVSWESDSDDEFDYTPVSNGAAQDITQQLIKDGYNLDSIPDDEDLDLIPLKPLSQRCPCCGHYGYACVIQ